MDNTSSQESPKWNNYLERYYEFISLIGRWFVWTIGDGHNIRLDENYWDDCGEKCKLPKGIINYLKGRWLCTLS
jgi:hypothetical protein